MDLFPFQISASTEIAEKFASYAGDPLMITRTRTVPFYQNLSAITGGGKTLILCDAITQIRSVLPVEPIVLWLSKGKVVVWQTYSNLVNGKYSDLISGYEVKPLMECRSKDIENAKSGLILVATVGKFNQRDKEEGDRKVYQLALDNAEDSLWDMLKKRLDSEGRKRPFIIVYDEGHNLSNQQTELLLELEPDALIAASATMRIPDVLSNSISRLRSEKGWDDNHFATVVKSAEVVNAGLVKQNLLLGGYVTPMEVAIDDLLTSFKHVEETAKNSVLPFKPKAIYVSNTNLVSGGSDNIHTSFENRQSRPILIWRHLVENREIEPEKIAVYCNLKFDPKFPPPPEFNLFSGGDSDYDRFIDGDFQHIIFNLTLQEGWDDPSCYFAYIDKDMGSKDQITQIVGRVLRQPNAQHYPDPNLNTAHFFIRTDEKKLFEEVLEEVRQKITTESPEISLTVFTGGKGAVSKLLLEPKKEKELPEVIIDAEAAVEPICQIISSLHDYREDKLNTVGQGGRIQVLQAIGSNNQNQDEWVELEHSNKVTSRWIFVREIQKTYSRALNVCDIELPKFDALVEYNSPAASAIKEAANRVVLAYINHSQVVQLSTNSTPIPAINIDPSKKTLFQNAIHESYSDLNSFEKEFAIALDRTQRVWCRNLSRGLFEIPLLSLGGSKNFNPDFIVWLEKSIVVIDTKGDHLIVEDSGRKLFHVKKIDKGHDIIIKLITKGKWNEMVQKENSDGYTVWGLRNGKLHPIHVINISDAVKECLK